MKDPLRERREGMRENCFVEPGSRREIEKHGHIPQASSHSGPERLPLRGLCCYLLREKKRNLLCACFPLTEALLNLGRAIPSLAHVKAGAFRACDFKIFTLTSGDSRSTLR